MFKKDITEKSGGLFCHSARVHLR